MKDKTLIKLIEEIFQQPDIKDNPPVLIDIGASGYIHGTWEMIATYSVCIAFDADDRDVEYIQKENSGYKKLIFYNRLVSERDEDDTDFFLTQAPYCSSKLEPDLEKLKHYQFSEQFKVKEKVKLKSVSLPSVLKEHGISKIDWFKSDSQGTDLRLFQSLDGIYEKIIVAEFEPGIINAYKNEDKLYSLMSFMDSLCFWMCNMNVKDSYRISHEQMINFSTEEQKKIHRSLKQSPAWAEISFLNTYDSDAMKTKRELLLGWVFATLQRQYGFAFHLAEVAENRFQEKLFTEMKKFSRFQLINPPSDFRNRIINKIIRSIKPKE